MLMRLLVWGASLGLLYVSMMAVFVGVMAPAKLVEPVVETLAAAEQAHRDDRLYTQLVERLAIAGRARLEPSEAVQLFSPWQNSELGRVEISATERRYLDVSLSKPLGTTWLNVELTARELRWSDGRFETLVLDSLSIGGWDVTALSRGKDISGLVNRRLGSIMRRNPHARSLSEAISALEWNGRHLMLDVHRDRLDAAFPRAMARR
ncbi:MAG: hypothetical protein CL927_08320 [Deltaproteobacteria bacterium]|nr:hypothetical protein [Deltaproteobacteria bacterium]HCH61204.1 hypothetical protein [Deltaproteobacteria bacterium]